MSIPTPDGEQDALRAGLASLAEEGRAAAVDIGDLLAQGRRARRRRAAVSAGAGVLLILGGASAASRAWWVGHSQGAASSSATAPERTAAVSGAAPRIPAVTWTPDPDHPRLGPAAPRIGVPYPFDLLTHCGIHWASFGGRTWATDTTLPEPKATPDPGTGSTVYTGYTAGYMTLTGPDTLRFDAPGGVSAVFRPTDAAAALCA